MTRCTHCNGLLIGHGDRSCCINCGRSNWAGFVLRKPTPKDLNVIGSATGIRPKRKEL